MYCKLGNTEAWYFLFFTLESFSRVETQKSSMIDKDPTAKETTPFTSMHVFSAVDIITSAGLACSRRRETSHGNDQTLISVVTSSSYWGLLNTGM